MADFVAVLRKTIGTLGDNTPEMREMVYDKARATIEAKLAAITPPPPAAVAERQRKALEDAIAVVRADYADAPEDTAEDDDLESVFASLNAAPEGEPRPDVAPVVPIPAPTVATPEPAAPEPFVTPPLAPPRVAGTHEQATPSPPFDPIAELDSPAKPEAATPEQREAVAAAAREDRQRRAAATKSGGRRTGLVAALLLLALVAGGGYAVWVNKDDFSRLIGLGPAGAPPAEEDAAATPVDAEADLAATEDDEVGETEEAAVEPEEAPEADEEDVAVRSQEEAAPGEPEKFTQRLLPDGQEVDEGPAGGPRTLGEGSSIASVAQPEEPPAPSADGQAPAAEAETAQTQDDEQAAPPAVAVGQRAIFYEERTSSAQGSAESGSIVWSTVRESPGGDLPAEPAIRAEATIPGKDVQLRMTVRRNGDQSLPAAHIVEMIFLTPENFEGGNISNVSRIALKETEQAAGSPLIGIPAKIADGFFLIALGDAPAEIEANTTLLLRQSWIDIPIVYQSGRRALLSLEKGIPGDRVFQDVLRAWSEADSG